METVVIFNFIIVAVVGIIYFQDFEKGQRVIKKALESFSSMFPILVLSLIFFVVIEVFLSNMDVLNLLLNANKFTTFPMFALLGAFSHIPLFIAFPLMSQFLFKGIDPGFIAVYITTLLSVHTFSLPIEIKTMGLKFALVRNITAFIVAIIIGIIIGVIY